MNLFNEKLQELQQQIDRKNHVAAMVSNLYHQREELEIKVERLEEIKQKEQTDVEKWEGRSLSAFFYQVVGKLDEKLTKERQEAYEAAVQYDAAVRELGVVNEALRKAEVEWRSFGDCEGEYQRLWEEKEQLVRNSDTPEARKILQMEAQISSLESRKKEIQEALDAGSRAYSVAGLVLKELDDAKSWSYGDLIGGGFLTDAMKHSHLDQAQGQMEQLQISLRRFHSELADVTIYADLPVNIEGFLRFSDYFFDGLFVDLAVLNRIENSQEQVTKIKDEIHQVITRLESMNQSAAREQDQLRTNVKNLISSFPSGLESCF